MRAQIGLGDPTGGIIVLLIFAGLAGLGLILCVAAIVFFFRKRGPRAAPPLLLVLGLLLASPGLWFGWEMLVPETPREKSWDFSTGRDVARLGEERKAGSDYYLGNIRSTIRLPGGRQWSGHAYLVVVGAQAGQVTSIHWQGFNGKAEAAYAQARGIARGLSFPGQALEDWYGKVRRGEQASFAHAVSEGGMSLEMQVRGSVQESGSWTAHVYVRWRDR